MLLEAPFFDRFRPIAPELLATATPAERKGYQDALTRYVALQSPLDYAQYVTPGTNEYRHIKLLNSLIVALTEHRLYEDGPGEPGVKNPDDPSDDTLRRPRQGASGPEYDPEGDPVKLCLFVTMPPRHGKSYLISEHTPPWFLSRWPDGRVILTSYEAEFAGDWGRKGKQHIQTHPEFGVKTNPESSAKSQWDLAHPHRGGMNTAGAGGPITGKGAHLLVIDDPIKNSEQAFSEVEREKQWDWMISTAMSRLEPGGVTILVHTRWHEDDLGGRCLKEQPGEWYHIDLPALAIEGEEDALGRAPGEALCPERYSRAALEKIRGRSGSYWFGALYQQRPSSSGDGIFQRDNFRYWTQATTGDGSVLYQLHTPDGGIVYHAKEDCLHFQTIDLAVTAKTSSDFSVVSTWAATPNRELLLVGRERHRLEAADQSAKIRDWWDSWRLTTKLRFLGVEKTCYHLEVIQTLRRGALPIKELTPDKDKVARAIPAGALCEGGRAYFPKRAEWLEEWEYELLQFPNGKHDDQVDTFSYAVSELHKLPVRRRKKEEPGGRKMDDRLAARLDKMLNKRKKRHSHPELGRL